MMRISITAETDEGTGEMTFTNESLNTHEFVDLVTEDGGVTLSIQELKACVDAFYNNMVMEQEREQRFK